MGYAESTVFQVVYSVPDQVDIVDLPAHVMQHQMEVYHSPSDYNRHTSAKMGLHFQHGMFASSAGYDNIRQATVNHSYSVEDITVHQMIYQANLEPGFAVTLGEVAHKFLTSLPNTFHEDPAKYLEFVRVFGTHYLTSASFGGVLRHYMKTNTDIFKEMSEFEVKAQAELAVINRLNSGGNLNHSLESVDERFESMTETQTR